MSGINKVILVGHLGRTPELRTLENNTVVTSFSLATTEKINKKGAETEITEWHEIVIWRGLAEMAVKLLVKGQLVCLEGKVATRRFTDKEGIQRYATEIIADKFTPMGLGS